MANPAGQERLAAALNAAAGADVFGVAGADDGDADSAGAATPVDDSDKQQQLSEGSVSRQLAAMAADKAAAGGDSSSSSRTGWQQQQKQRRGDGLGSSSSSAEPEPVLPLLPTQSARDAAVATALPAAALYVAPADAVVVLWALGHAGYQASAAGRDASGRGVAERQGTQPQITTKQPPVASPHPHHTLRRCPPSWPPACTSMVMTGLT
jgi:hypothetical protein